MKKKWLLVTIGLVVILSLVFVACRPVPPPAPPPAPPVPAPAPLPVPPPAPPVPAPAPPPVPKPAAPPEVFKWKIQSLWATGSPNFEILTDFTKRVAKITNGRVLIEPLPAGAIVPTFEVLDAVKAGALQGHDQWPGYWSGKDPAFAALGALPFSFTEWWQFEHWFRYGGGLAMLRELYAQHGLYTIGMEWWGIESLPSKVPIRKLEDLKGLKMRNPGGINAPIFAKFGVSLIVLPGEEIYGALERGVINFTDWGTPSMNYKFGFHEVTKYFTWPGFHHMPNADFSVRMDEWKKLSDDLKATLEAATRDWAWDSLVRLGFEDIKAVEAMKAKGLEALKWDPAEVARLREIAITAWDEWATKNPMSARAIESQKDFMRKLGLLK